MKILVLSFYYSPDIGPGALRAQSIVDSILDCSRNEIEIDVLTTKPNRYHSHLVTALERERAGSLSIVRFNLPVHQSGMIDQVKAFSVFARSVVNETRGREWDIVVATSSRLMTAVLAAWIARRSKAKLFLDIRDLFTETMSDVLENSIGRYLLPIFRQLERWTFRSADALNIVSAGFIGHVRKVLPDYEPLVFTNGIDEEFLNKDFTDLNSDNLPLVLYAGNIGESQALDAVIPAISKMMAGQVKFRIIGDGGRRRALEKAIDLYDLKNVEILMPVERSKLLVHYCEASILFLHLNNYKAFQSVIPSKLFEYAAIGKPIIAGVTGYVEEFIYQNIEGVFVFKPCDTSAMKNALLASLIGPKHINREIFCNRYSRKKIMRQMAKKIIELKLAKK